MVCGKGPNGGDCGQAIKPIAMQMVRELAQHPEIGKVAISGIGGIETWRDVVEYILLGASSVQVCTAAMHYGFGIVREMEAGVQNFMKEKGYHTIYDFCGKALPNATEWKHLNLHYKVVANIHAEKCIGCQLCYIACDDGAHQAIALPANGDGTFNLAVQGLHLTADGFNKITSSLGLINVGKAALAAVSDFGSISMSINSVAVLPQAACSVSFKTTAMNTASPLFNTEVTVANNGSNAATGWAVNWSYGKPTLLLNVASAEWDEFMLERLRIPRAVLPQVVSSSLRHDAPLATLGAHAVPITGIAGDQQAALFGQACFEPGMAKNPYGTGRFLLKKHGERPNFFYRITEPFFRGMTRANTRPFFNAILFNGVF